MKTPIESATHDTPAGKGVGSGAPFRRPLSRRRIWAARLLALVADALQWIFLPLLGVGFISPAMDVMDVFVGMAMIVLVGWHWAFLPSFIAEVIPGVGLIPTWTLAVFFATRKRR